MSALPRAPEDQSYKYTRDWGDNFAAGLWSDLCQVFDVAWEGARVLDFGCAWGYLPKLLIEHAGVREAYGVDLDDQWNQMLDGFRPQDVPGVSLHQGDVRSVPELQPLKFDVIVTAGTLFVLKPSDLMSVLQWFADHLEPDGHCLVHTRVFTHYDGADLGWRSPAFTHLLFGQREIDTFLERHGTGPARYINPSCAATYLAQFVAAGFRIERVLRSHDGLDERLFAEHAGKLHWLDPAELRTSLIRAHLRLGDGGPGAASAT